MKNRSVSKTCALLCAALTASAFADPLAGWSSDLAKALAVAKSNHKSVLVEFTGSDWCAPCITMRKNVFSQVEFVDPASKEFILVEIDFPQGDAELRKKNQPLAEKYQIIGFPTVILLTPGGMEFDRFFATAYPTIDGFLTHLSEATENKAPEVSVQQPANSEIADGGKVSFGTVKVDKSSSARVFVIRNLGAADLTNLSLNVSGLGKSEFVVTKLATTSLAPGASTSFKVTFKPAAIGTRTALIQIANNDSDESPFDIKLAGMGSKK